LRRNRWHAALKAGAVQIDGHAGYLTGVVEQEPKELSLGEVDAKIDHGIQSAVAGESVV